MDEWRGDGEEKKKKRMTEQNKKRRDGPGVTHGENRLTTQQLHQFSYCGFILSLYMREHISRTH